MYILFEGTLKWTVLTGLSRIVLLRCCRLPETRRDKRRSGSILIVSISYFLREFNVHVTYIKVDETIKANEILGSNAGGFFFQPKRVERLLRKEVF